MSLEKVLQKIQEEIKDLAPTLELFLEDTIQPSANDCLKLQQQLYLLQENIAIYKYNKLNKEISPSFNIHAKVSQTENLEVKTTIRVEQKNDPLAHEKHVDTPAKAAYVDVDKDILPSYPPFVISLNDKFRFINELFAQNHSEYYIALEQLNNLKNWNDTEIYLNSLKNLYDWKDKSDIVKYFYALIKKRFD